MSDMIMVPELYKKKFWTKNYSEKPKGFIRKKDILGNLVCMTLKYISHEKCFNLNFYARSGRLFRWEEAYIH